MKKKAKVIGTISVVIMLFLPFTSCIKIEEKTDRYSFWKGDIEN